jgi:hypothetical protein
MDARRFGDATLHGWRAKVSDRVARRAPVADDVARAALGGLFFLLSLRYVVRSLRTAAREIRA